MNPQPSSPEWFLEQLGAARRCAFLNYAGRSPILRCVIEAMVENLNSRCEDPDYSPATWAVKDEVKKNVSNLIRCDLDEIAFTPNVSLGVLTVASSLRARGYKKVVCVGYDFPSVTLPWKALGYEVYFSDSHSVDEIVEVYSRNKCEVVSVSHVNYLTGERIDLKALTREVHRMDGLVLIDAYQSVGAMMFDVKQEDVDFLVFGFGKWLLGPVISVLYVRKDHIEDMIPITVSWLSNRDPFSFHTDKFELSSTADRFEGASLDFALKVGASKSAEVFSNVDYESAKNRILSMTGRVLDLVEELGFKHETPWDPDRRLGIVSFKVDNAVAFVKKLREMGVIAAARRGRVRLSIHFFTRNEDLGRLEDALVRLAKQ